MDCDGWLLTFSLTVMFFVSARTVPPCCALEEESPCGGLAGVQGAEAEGAAAGEK